MRRSLLLALPMVLLLAYAGWVAWRGGGPAPGMVTADPLAEAWRRAAERPQRPDAWTELAERQLELGQEAAAERSLWTAIELGDRDGSAHARLGFLLYAQHRDEEALTLLRTAREREVTLPLLDHTLSVLEARQRAALGAAATPSVAQEAPSPPAAPDPGPDPDLAPENASPALARADAGVPTDGPDEEWADCTLPLERIEQGNTLALEVEIEGEPARLIFDTGASLTVLTRELAADLELPLDVAHSITALTANGRVEMPTAVLDEVVVAGQRVEQLRVAICADCVGEVADGLLGLDLQTILGMQMDPGSSTLRLRDCGPPSPGAIDAPRR